MKNTERSKHDIYGITKGSVMHITGIPDGRKTGGSTLEAHTAENFPKLKEDIRFKMYITFKHLTLQNQQ